MGFKSLLTGYADSFVHVGPEELLLEENDDLADILQTKLNM